MQEGGRGRKPPREGLEEAVLEGDTPRRGNFVHQLQVWRLRQALGQEAAGSGVS